MKPLKDSGKELKAKIGKRSVPKALISIIAALVAVAIIAGGAAFLSHSNETNSSAGFVNTTYTRTYDNTLYNPYESGVGALNLTICTVKEGGTGLYVSMDCSEDNKIGELSADTKVLLIKEWELTSLITTEDGISGFVRTEVLNAVERIASPTGNVLFTGGFPIPVYKVWPESGLAMYKDVGRSTEPVMTLAQDDIVYGLGKQGKIRLVYYPMLDRLGYVDTDSLDPICTPLLSGLSLVGCDNLMTYDQMMLYINRLESQPEYAELIRVESLGTTELGNDIPYIVIGKKSAAHKLLITAGMEGNETLYSNLLLKQVEMILKYYNTGSCDGRPWSSIFEQVAVYIVPMVNPDGAVINEKGIDVITDETLRKKLLAQNFDSNDFSVWKSNAHGVALDNNFSDGFADILNGQTAAGENGYTDEEKQYRLFNYGGEVAGSETETRCLAALVTSAGIDAVINITDFGNNIEWYVPDNEISSDNFLFAEELSRITSYSVAGEDAQASQGSFYAWCNKAVGIPAANLNIGNVTPSTPIEQFRILWQRTSMLLPEAANWLMSNSGTVEEETTDETEEGEEGEDGEDGEGEDTEAEEDN